MEIAEVETIPTKEWETERIGNVLKVIRGVSFKKDERSEEKKEAQIACLRTANVQKEVDWSDLWFIDEAIVSREEQFVKKRDILMSTANSLELLGKVSLVKNLPHKTTLGTFIVNIRVPENISSKFIYYQLCGQKFINKVREKASTTTNISNLSTSKLKDIEIKLPPLDLQHRIVEKIEELFSELDNGIENLKRAKQQLETYKQSVLKAALEGKLTKEWREQQDELPTPEELREQIGEERQKYRERQLKEWEQEVEEWKEQGEPGRKPRKPSKLPALKEIKEDEVKNIDEVPSSWLWLRTQEVGEWNGGGTPRRSNVEYWEDGSIPWVSPKDMKRKDITTTQDLMTEKALSESSSARMVDKNSLLFVTRSGILRRTLPVAIAKNKLTINQDLKALTPAVDILSEYIYWYCKANDFEIRRKCSKDGTTVESIKTQAIKDYPVPVCSPEEQK